MEYARVLAYTLNRNVFNARNRAVVPATVKLVFFAVVFNTARKPDKFVVNRRVERVVAARDKLFLRPFSLFQRLAVYAYNLVGSNGVAAVMFELVPGSRA